MATSDSFLIYIRSSGDFNFAVVASSDDDIASLKKEAEAQHLALFPHNGRIVSQAIKIWDEGIVYNLSDNIPVRCLFDVDGVNKRKHLLYMDAVPVPLTVPLDEVPPTGRDRDCSLNQNQGGNTNTNCASDTLKRKDPVVEEMTTVVTDLGEGNNSSKEKKSKEVDLNSNASVEELEPESESRKTGGDRMQERSAIAVPENETETAGIHVVTWNPEAASADVVVMDATVPGGNANGSNYNKKGNNMAWVKEARKESTTNAGETSSLAPSDSDLRDKGTVTPDNQITDNNPLSYSPPDADIAMEVGLGKTKRASQPISKTTDKEKMNMNKSQNNSISATDSIAASPSDKKKRHTREKVFLSLPPIIERENENEISREDSSKKKKRKKQDATQQLDLCQNGDPSNGRDRDCSLNQNQGGNANSTSEALKRKSLGDNTNFHILLDAASADMEVLDAVPRVNEITTLALKSGAVQKGSSVAAKGGPSPAASTSPITEDEIRKVLLSSANITLKELIHQFMSRLRNRDVLLLSLSLSLSLSLYFPLLLMCSVSQPISINRFFNTSILTCHYKVNKNLNKDT
ncbi:uncharacterized protein LOC144563184 isoform X2 [Carex rostrata]